MKKIILAGGGSAGHVTPNIALLPSLYDTGYAVEYIGGKSGIEKELIEKEGVRFHGISTGKLHRDRLISLRNLTDMFSAVAGVGDAISVIRRVKPDVIFSKGGFVGLPVAIAGKLCHVSVILHECDLTPGLANRLSAPFASAICASFPETMNLFPAKKSILTGNPIRRELFTGKRSEGLSLCKLSGQKPLILAMGGSLGSQTVNEALRAALPKLLSRFEIVHITGRGKLDAAFSPDGGYVQFEYVTDGLKDLFAACDIIISRAGSNSINEFLALRKPSLLIPLSNRATRGDQIKNAASFAKRGFSSILEESSLTPDSLITAIDGLYKNRSEFISNMEKSPIGDTNRQVMQVIERFSGN